MTCGCVITSRSLQPFRSRGQSLKRSPRNAASSSLRRWIIVPIAPSRMTMRSANSARRRCARWTCRLSGIGHLALALLRTHAERVADRVGEFGTIQRVEMELLDAVTLQRVHLLDRDRGGNQLARLRVFLEAVEAVLEP